MATMHGRTQTDSFGVVLVELSDADGTLVVDRNPPPLTAHELLHLMRARIPFYGSPLPEGYVPPPGIDLDALLKEVPWPPPATNG